MKLEPGEIVTVRFGVVRHPRYRKAVVLEQTKKFAHVRLVDTGMELDVRKAPSTYWWMNEPYIVGDADFTPNASSSHPGNAS